MCSSFSVSPCEQPAGRDAGPGGDDLGDVVGADLLLDHARPAGAVGLPSAACAAASSRSSRGSRRRGCRDAASRSPSRCSRSASLRSVVELRLEVADAVEAGLLLLPAGVSARRAAPRGRPGPRAAARAAPRTPGRPSRASASSSIFSRSTARRSSSISTGDGVDLHPQPGRGLVDEVDGLVGQLAAGDVAVGERGGGDERGVGDGDLVVRLVALLEPAQDARWCPRRDGSPTKTCWKRRSRAASFSMCSRYSSSVVAPIMRSSPRASIGLSMLPASMAPSPRARADDGVQLVDEGDDLTVGAP